MPWAAGLGIAASPVGLGSLVLGTVIGLFLGTMPGLGPVFALTLFIPLTNTLAAGPALIFLAGLYTSGVYGGAITAILLSTPGTPGNIAATFDGYQMALKGRAGEAIAATGIGGALGGMIAILAVITVSPLISSIALDISPADYFLLAILGLSIVSASSGEKALQGIILTGIGFLISMVGEDPITGQERFTFGLSLLSNGINFSVLTIGLFAVARAFTIAEASRKPKAAMPETSLRSSLGAALRATFGAPLSVLRASLTGVVMGVLPGLGIAAANIVAWLVEARLHPEAGFGEGNTVGVMVAETADNATMVSELIPTLTLGIPGHALSALILVAVTIHGLEPGIAFFRGTNPVAPAFLIAMALSQIAFALLGIGLSPALAKAARIPASILAPMILVASCVGAFAVEGSVGDVLLALAFGFVGYVLIKLDYPLAPLVLGAILGPLAESNYRRAILIASTTGTSPFLHPIALLIITASLFAFAFPLYGQYRRWRAGGRGHQQPTALIHG